MLLPETSKAKTLASGLLGPSLTSDTTKRTSKAIAALTLLPQQRSVTTGSAPYTATPDAVIPQPCNLKTRKLA